MAWGMTETTTQKKSIPAGSFADKKWRFCRAFYKKLGIDLKKLLEIPSNKHPEKNKTASDHWNTFLKKIIEPKKSAAHNGWRWLCAISYLVDIRHPRYIREDLPDEHPLKLDNATFINFETLAENLKSDLGNPTKIEKIDFSGLTFKECVDFSNFIFPIDVDFSNTKFLKNVYFNNAIFYETADFEDAEFQEKKSYSKETAKFRNTVFKKIANFRNATFWGYANFKGSKLMGRAFFQEAKFKCHAPRFYDATFNNEITWAGIKLPYFTKARVDKYKKVKGEFIPISDRKFFTRIKHRKIIKKNHRRRIEENQNSYENTSILLKEANKYHDQHFFFRQEMRCRRWLGNFFNCSLYWLYQLSADYGYGVGLALACWALHIILGVVALIFFITPSWEYTNPEFQKILNCAMPVSFANANPYTFFGFESEKLKSCYEMLENRLPIGSGVIQIVQSIMGTLFLFLLLLTLRVRFRLNSTTSNTTIKATITPTPKKK